MLGSILTGMGHVQTAGQAPVTGARSDIESLVFARAQQLLGTSISKVFGTEFENTAWYNTALINTGTAPITTTERGGLLSPQTGAGAASSARVFPVGAPSHLDNPTSLRWYATSRLRFNTGVDANANIAFAPQGPAGGVGPFMYVGANGNVSTTLWSYDLYTNAGAPAASGTLVTALDIGVFHSVELWGNTVTFNVAIDGITRLTLAWPAAMTNPISPQLFTGNGATAADRSMGVDYVYFCVGNP